MPKISANFLIMEIQIKRKEIRAKKERDHVKFFQAKLNEYLT